MGIEIQWSGDEFAEALNEAAERALQDAADLILDESNRIAPIETGDLIRSGNTAVEGNTAAVGYTSVYATRQHEELSWQHDAGRQAKFLETAVRQNADRVNELFAQHLGDALS
ncbi:hypothetical protein [Gordonia terrae]